MAINSSSLPSATYCSVNWVSIGSGNGLSPLWHQAITWTDVDLLNKLQWNLNPNKEFFIYENAFEKIVCEMGVFSLGGDELMGLQSNI